MIPISVSATSGPLSYGRRGPRTAWPQNVSLRTSAEVRALAFRLLLMVAVAVALGFGHVGIRIRATELGYDGLAAQQVLQKLELEEKQLLAEVEKLSSDQRLERIAMVRLGMVRPQKGQILTLP